MKWWNSLRVKIIAWSFVPTVIILSAVAWFTFYSYQKVIGNLAIKQDRENAQEIVTKALTSINNKVVPILLPLFLDTDILRSGTLQARAENFLEHIEGGEIFDGGIYFLDGQGVIFKTIPEQPELIGQDWSDHQANRFVYEHSNSTFPTDIISLGSSGKKVVCTTMAMLGPQAETEGLVYFCYAINSQPETTLNTIFRSADLGSGVSILDSKHQVIHSPNLADNGRDLSGEAYLQELLRRENQSGRFRIGNEEFLASYVSMLNVPGYAVWGLLKEQSWSEIMQPTLAYRQLLLVLLALGVVVPALVTAYGVRHITEPIQKLIHASKQVTAGQFKQQIEVKTGDEIETLADQFNIMSAKLDESYSMLEKKVADRTRELATVNSIISVASQSLDIQQILEQGLNQTVEQMGFEAGAAFKLDAETGAAMLVTQKGFEGVAALNNPDINFSTTQAQVADIQAKVSNIEIQDLRDGMLRDQLIQAGFQLLIHVPLSTKGRNLGFFILGKHEPVTCTPEELTLLGSIGQQIGVAMENAHLYEQAELTAITQERNRLARELHDAVTQTLFSASLIADVIPRIWKRDPEEGMKNLEELRQLTRGALAEMRTLLLEMRPESLERADLKSLLTQLADAFIGRVRVPVSLDIQGECEVTQEVKLAFYRVAQEALNNIAKHSGARQVEVHLKCEPKGLNLSIRDDGLGFDPEAITANHLGITIMRERANSIGATLKIESQPGQGTTVELGWRGAEED